MEPVVSHKVWTDEDLMNLPEVGGKYELVEGELILAATNFRHDTLVMRLGGLLDRFVREREVGVVAGPDMGCRMKNGNVRCPDVSFISGERARHYVDEDPDSFFEGSPDLVVEILSPSDKLDSTRRKAIEYFESGSHICWIVDPRDRTVLVLESNGSERLLTVADTLDGGTVLPGFSISISALLEKPRLR